VSEALDIHKALRIGFRAIGAAVEPTGSNRNIRAITESQRGDVGEIKENQPEGILAIPHQELPAVVPA